ncbi:MAG: nickel-binding protein [Betaproteobacteria bacterium]
MSVFMVERSLKGISMSELGQAQQAAIQAASQLSRLGTPVRYLRSTFVPESGACMCLFEACDASAVQQLNESARLPYTRIVPALDLAP